jgi:hypothetical protein
VPADPPAAARRRLLHLYGLIAANNFDPMALARAMMAALLPRCRHQEIAK